MMHRFVRIARRVVWSVDIGMRLKDGKPHLKRHDFDLRMIELGLKPELANLLDIALDRHDDFMFELAQTAMKDYVSDSDYRKFPTMKNGMMTNLRQALDVAESLRRDIDWSDVENLVTELSKHDPGRPPNKDDFIGGWDKWLFLFHDAMSGIANRSGEGLSVRTSSLARRIARRFA
jgi:hypothetical protein